MSQGVSVQDVNLYSILALPSPGSGVSVTPQQVKAAFRRAVLIHHPDKSTTILQNENSHNTERNDESGATSVGSQMNTVSTPRHPTVDDLRFARDVLTDPASRREYDRKFITNASLSSHSNAQTGSVLKEPAGLETVDLDEMDYNEETGIWSRPCRCGNEVAFQIAEGDLEAAAGEGEVLLSCSGCSLHARILFQVEEESYASQR